jgi:hypothetical protein
MSAVWNREKLYEEVWSEPVTKVAQRYGVSDVAIAKACRKLSVPVPGRGYWAKKASGYSVARRPLPRLERVPVVVRLDPHPPKPSFPSEPADIDQIGQIEDLLSSGALDPHPGAGVRHRLVTQTRNVLSHGFKDSRKILHGRLGEKYLDLRVSKSTLKRALEIAGMLITVLESQGIAIAIAQRYERRESTFATIFSQEVQFAILEKVREISRDPRQLGNSAPEYMNTGELSIQVLSTSNFFKRSWRDKEGRPVETLIPQCIASMMKIAVEHQRDAEKRRQLEVFQSMQEQEAERLKAFIRAEETRVQRLEDAAKNWARAKLIREYVVAFTDCKMKEGHQLSPNSALGKWVAWASQQADRIDPLVESPPSILDRKVEIPKVPRYAWER